MKANKVWIIPVSIGLVLAVCVAWYTRPMALSDVLEQGVDRTVPTRVYLSVRTLLPEDGMETYGVSPWSGTGEYDELMALWDGVSLRKSLESFVPRDSILYEGDEATTAVDFTVIDTKEPAGACYMTVGEQRVIVYDPARDQHTFYDVKGSPRQALLAYGKAHGEVR